MPLRMRLTLWSSIAIVVVLCVFGADVAWNQNRLGQQRVDRDLAAVAATLSAALREEIEEHGPVAKAAEEATQTLAGLGKTVAILDDHGTPIAANWDRTDLRDRLLQDRLPTSAASAATWTVATPGATWRVHAQPEPVGSVTWVLLSASSLADVRREQHEVQEALLVAIPLALLLAGGGGLWLATVGLRPITEMAARATQIPLTGLEDLGHTDRTDELGQLARAFNQLVARLRAALQTQRQFMADASHELRTPVSVVRTAADVALVPAHREEADYRETLGIVGDQARRLSRLVADMLVLARADAGGYCLHPVDLYLDEVVADCHRSVGVLAAERGVLVNVAGLTELPFRGDEELLRQLVLNVLQNAVQHTPSGGVVTVAATKDSRAITIRIADTGRGIAEADRARIFDRFVQLDPSRRAAGTGLGLPIAKWIAEAHHGTLVLETSGPDGSTFCLTLPTDRTE